MKTQLATSTRQVATTALRSREPALMKDMAHVLGIDGVLAGEAREAAAGRCAGCTDTENCRHWLEIASIAGADRAPNFCLNVQTFDELSTEAPSTF